MKDSDEYDNGKKIRERINNVMTPDHGPIDMGRRRLLVWSGVGGAALMIGSTGLAGASLGESHSRPSLRTRLTDEYGVQYPFAGAGMGFVSVPALVAAVSNAGGIGVLGNGIEPPPSTQALIQMVKASTSQLFGVDFIFDDTGFGPAVTEAHIDVCIAEHVRLVVFHMFVPPKAWVDKLHAAGAKVWMQAGSVQTARDAVAIGFDAIIAQGVQAGGHNLSVTRTLKLLGQIIDAVHPTMVLASGGIANGRAVVNALSRGAEGVWVGTRLVASNEAYAHPEYKQRIVAAKGNSTVTTTMFGPEYPDRPYRVLRNRVVNQWAGNESSIPVPAPPPAVIGNTLLFPLTLRVPYQMPKFSVIVPSLDTVGDFEEMGLAAGGESAKDIHRILPAGQIVAEMMAEAKRLIREWR